MNHLIQIFFITMTKYRYKFNEEFITSDLSLLEIFALAEITHMTQAHNASSDYARTMPDAHGLFRAGLGRIVACEDTKLQVDVLTCIAELSLAAEFMSYDVDVEANKNVKMQTKVSTIGDAQGFISRFDVDENFNRFKRGSNFL